MKWGRNSNRAQGYDSSEEDSDEDDEPGQKRARKSGSFIIQIQEVFRFRASKGLWPRDGEVFSTFDSSSRDRGRFFKIYSLRFGVLRTRYLQRI